MLLETLDIKKNDIIIFSQNIFNLDKNFKIIFKDDNQMLSRKINYSDVCKFVNEFTPKNLIVYRLLTNFKDFRIDLTKYGFQLFINSERELIYFDPIYAVKEIEKYKIMMDINELRFRIQQVGLTTLNRKKNLPNYAEIYSIDLEAMEAKFQNDKVFADAITSIAIKIAAESKNEIKSNVSSDLKNSEKQDSISGTAKIKKDPVKISADRKESLNEIRHEISEDKNFDHSQVLKMNIKENISKTGSGEKVKSVKTGKDEQSAFSKFLSKKRSENYGKNERSSIVDIFNSSTPLKEFISSREDKKIVLKLDKK